MGNAHREIQKSERTENTCNVAVLTALLLRHSGERSHFQTLRTCKFFSVMAAGQLDKIWQGEEGWQNEG